MKENARKVKFQKEKVKKKIKEREKVTTTDRNQTLDFETWVKKTAQESAHREKIKIEVPVYGGAEVNQENKCTVAQSQVC